MIREISNFETIAKIIRGKVSNATSEVPEILSITNDTRALERGDLYIAIKGANFDGHNFLQEAASKGAVGAVIERIPENSPPNFPLMKVDNTISAMLALSSHLRSLSSIPWVGITGSAGKTTTKELLSVALGTGTLYPEKSFNNNIGLPLTMLRLTKSHKRAVVELGTNSMGEIAALSSVARPTHGIITSIGEAHIEFFGSVSEIAHEKAQMLANIPPDGLALLPNECPEFDILKMGTNCELRTFGFNERADYHANNIRHIDGRTCFELMGHEIRLQLLGRANVLNATSSYAMATALGEKPEHVIERLESLKPPAMRGQVLTNNGITIYDDCYNANPLSMNSAIETFTEIPAKRRIAVIGEMLELGEASSELHNELGARLGGTNIDIFIVVGEKIQEISKSIANARGGSEPIYETKSSTEAAKLILEIARSNDAILVKGSRSVRLERVVHSLMA